MSAPNVLILDEPTNDLDTETMTILEDYLDGYDGIVITVSHDRYFLDRVVRRIFAFVEGGVLVQYEGGYTDYIQKRTQKSDNVASAGTSKSAEKKAAASKGAGETGEKEEAGDLASEEIKSSKDTWGHQKKIKFTYKEQKEYETIELDIEELELKIEELDRQMLENSSNYSKLSSITQEKEETEALLIEKMERWEYLEDLARQIAAQ